MIMSSKFAVIGVVSVLGAGVALHTGGRNCPMARMMSAFHQHGTQSTAVVKKVTPPTAKAVEASVVMK